MIIRLILGAAGLAAALVAATQTAAAQSLGGRYQITGQNLDGSSYSGTASIAMASDTVCRMVWVVGSTIWEGVCVRNGNSFAVSFVHDQSYGVALYGLGSDGTLNGLWTINGSPGLGKERLVPTR
jgi:hypothetical protein